MKEKFNWNKLRNLIHDGKITAEGKSTDGSGVVDMTGRGQSDLMLQIAKSLAKVASVSHTDYQKLNEKQDHRKILWNDAEGVHIKVTIAMNDIANASLQFCLWANKTTEERINNKIVFESKILGETYINLSTMFKDHSHEQFIAQSKVKPFQNKLWLHGICVGEIKGEIIVKTSPYLRQLVCGVLTDTGMAKSTNIISKNDDDANSKLVLKVSPKIKQLIKIKEDLISSVYLHLGKTNKKSKLSTQENLKHIKVLLSQLKTELEKTDKMSIVSFVYESKGELYTAQEHLIDTGTHLSSFVVEIDEEIKEMYFRNTLNVLDRGELMLDLIGFSDKQKQAIEDKAHDKTVKLKTKVALEYQKFLYDCLVISLNILNQKVN